MPDPLFQLVQDLEGSLKLNPTLRAQVGGDLLWAALNLRAARIGRAIVDRLARPAGFPELQALFQEEWDVLEVAAMSLGFEDTMTALDLCANAIYVACGGTPSASGTYKDLGYWTAARIATVTQPKIKGWLGGVSTSPQLQVMKTCRNALTHRSVKRHIRIGGGSGRSLVEIAQRPAPGAPATPSLGGIDTLIPDLLAFSEGQFIDCCGALKADFGI